ncbi:cellulose binding domain-containing protein, partial [Actinoplanes sp. NPDC049118]|uniref:cellulose binding domain-containing protein n=1 Tax=Actinoplanes sp. NPDC049118 TaxID=3155769 RepID=UPI003411AD29
PSWPAARAGLAAPPAPPGPPGLPGPALRPAFGADGPNRAPSRADDAGAPPNRPGGPPGRTGPGAPGPGRGTGTTQRRRLYIAGGSVAVLTMIAATAVLASADKPKDSVAGVQPTSLSGSSKCVVSYAVWSDANNRFRAAVTIANRDTTAIKDWKLWFVMPGDQVVSGNGGLRLDQQGRGVTVQSTKVLSPQQTETLQFTGRYRASNAAPMVFQLGGETCQTFVSPAPGAPSQPVEHLTNGEVRLGPVPTKESPIPGISINPSGVAVPVPVGTTGPGTTTSATASPTQILEPPPDDDDPVEPAPPTTDPTTPATTPPTTDPTTPPATPPTIPVEDPDPADVDPPGGFG